MDWKIFQAGRLSMCLRETGGIEITVQVLHHVDARAMIADAFETGIEKPFFTVFNARSISDEFTAPVADRQRDVARDFRKVGINLFTRFVLRGLEPAAVGRFADVVAP